MEEKIITGHKNGMLVLLLELVLYIAAVVFLIVGINAGFLPLIILCVIVLALGWIPLCGLRVLKPQEALVLTLFGKYIGTLKGEGFYCVNPFCTSFNPAAKTKLNQSGDVDDGRKSANLLAAMQASSTTVEVGGSKKISLKIMTLNNGPPEDQRLPGQPRGDRHRRDVARDRHRQGRFQRGQLQGIPLPPVRRGAAQHCAHLPL